MAKRVHAENLGYTIGTRRYINTYRDKLCVNVKTIYERISII